MKIYQVYEVNRLWEYSDDICELHEIETLLKSFVFNEKAQSYKRECEKALEKQKEDALFCSKCPINHMTIRKLHYYKNSVKLNEYCAQKKEEGFLPCIYFINAHVVCNNAKKYPEESYFIVKEIEVEE